MDFEQQGKQPIAWGFWKVKLLPDAFVVKYYADENSLTDLPAIVDRTLGHGRVLLFTTVLDGRRLVQGPSWNNYWDSSSFGFVLANLALRYLTGNMERNDLNHFAGDRVLVPVPPGPFNPLYKLRGLTFQKRRPYRAARGRISLTSLRRPSPEII